MEKGDIPVADKEKINFRNAKTFFGRSSGASPPGEPLYPTWQTDKLGKISR